MMWLSKSVILERLDIQVSVKCRSLAFHNSQVGRILVREDSKEKPRQAMAMCAQMYLCDTKGKMNISKRWFSSLPGIL